MLPFHVHVKNVGLAPDGPILGENAGTGRRIPRVMLEFPPA